MILSFFTYFFGSTPGDFEQVEDDHPFESCPNSPNCTYLSQEFKIEASSLFATCHSVIRKMSPFAIQSKDQSLILQAVFKIPFFGFKDDLKVIVKQKSSHHSLLFIKSSSRVGHSDLGVNRRRIQKILSKINNQLQ